MFLAGFKEENCYSSSRVDGANEETLSWPSTYVLGVGEYIDRGLSSSYDELQPVKTVCTIEHRELATRRKCGG